MNQLVQALYKRSNVVANGHNSSNENLENDQAAPPNSPVDGVYSKEIAPSEVYKRIQHGADIPILGLQMMAPEKPAHFRHQTSDVIRKCLPPEEKEADKANRKKRLEELLEESRRRRLQEEAEKNAKRKHHDFYTPAQKSPISPNRYEDVVLSQQEPSSPCPDGLRSAAQLDLAEGFRGLHIQGRAKALFAFTAKNSRELSFKKGDILYLLHQVDKNWMLGEHYGQVGIFPLNYVEILPPLELDDAAESNRLGLARSKFDFTEKTSTELSLRKGDFVTILRRVDKNWLEGCIGARQGLLPASYVNVIREPSALNPAPLVMTPSVPGTPEVLSPMSWKTHTPPQKPSSNIFPMFSPDTSEYSYRQVEAFSYGSLSSDEYPEFNVSYQKGMLSPQLTDEDFDITMDRSDFSELFTTSTPYKSEVQSKPSSSANEINKSWSHCSDEDSMMRKFRAVCAYKPQNEDELQFEEDEELLVTRICDNGWLMGMSMTTGRFGTFPGSCVQESC
ncbi:hypothetical protein BsWGS_21027 [Bradybaena similaris]